MHSIQPPLFTLALENIQPSQVYVSQEKLNSIDYALRCGGAFLIPPVPVVKLQNRWTLSDGHTRCLGLYLHGYTEVQVYEDTDSFDQLMYRQCVKWCREELLYTIGDLKDRVIPHPVFESFWLRRCRVMHQLLYQNLAQSLKELS